MYIFSRLIISASALLIASNLYAAQHQEVECPSLTRVQQNALFTEVAASGCNDCWGVAAANFTTDRTWNVSMAVTLPGVKGSEAALKAANIFFQTEVVLSEPVKTVGSNYVHCQYAKKSGYQVDVYNPPFHFGH